MKHYGVVNAVNDGIVTSTIYDGYSNKQYRFECQLSRFKDPAQVMPGYLFVRIRTDETDYFEWYWSWRAREVNAPIKADVRVSSLENYVMTNEVMTDIDVSLKSGEVMIPDDCDTFEKFEAWLTGWTDEENNGGVK